MTPSGETNGTISALMGLGRADSDSGFDLGVWWIALIALTNTLGKHDAHADSELII